MSPRRVGTGLDTQVFQCNKLENEAVQDFDLNTIGACI